MQEQAATLADHQLPIMVVSHERSGTHFMMNALAECFGYVSKPWVNVDKDQLNFNYFQAPNLRTAMLAIAQARAPNIIKCHQEFGFYSSIISDFKDVLQIIYVYRNPADVMASFWRFVQSWSWMEGPRTDTALEFAKAAPMGNLMRFQYRQYETMLDRWANHVEHWLGAAERTTNIHPVKYEDLARRYEVTVKGLGATLALRPTRIVRPSRTENVVAGGSVDYAPAPGSDNRDAVAELAIAKFPALMAALGYAGEARKLMSA